MEIISEPIRIYLAGSIYGLTYTQATDWRIDFTEILKLKFGDKIEILNPTLKYRNNGYKPHDILDLKDFSDKDKADIFKKDMQMLNSANIMVVYIQGQSRGIGTINELGYICNKGSLTVGYIDDKSPLKNNPFVLGSLLTYHSLNGLLDHLPNWIDKILESRENL